MHGAILVVGVDSVIGSALRTELQQRGQRVVGTTRRPQEVNADTCYLDLAAPLEDNPLPWPVETAVICAGITRMETCRRDPVKTAEVNVHGTWRLIKGLLKRSTFVIYLSSNAVFDGKFPHAGTADPLSPTTEYGRQKAEVEKRLAGDSTRNCVVRFSKVLAPNPPFLQNWLRLLGDQQPIQAVSDLGMAPIPLAFAIELLSRVIERRPAGILQASGEQDVTYAQVAYRLVEHLRIDPSHVQSRTARELGLNLEAIPLHSTLDTSRIRSEFDLQPPPVWSTIDALLVDAAPGKGTGADTGDSSQAA